MIITLTTDFGLADPFVGIMKGVILGIAPNAQIVDISHEIRSYDIPEAAFILGSSYRYFPQETIHVVVVDPGVGSARRPIAAAANGHIFVGPDNGVLSNVLDAHASVYWIQNESLFRKPVSQTFHGRDIFAPVAAHLAHGAAIESVGPRITDFVTRTLPIARVIRVDKYGNIITNLRARHLGKEFVIRIGGHSITRLCYSFSEAAPGEFFAIEGSTGHIELALNQGSAAERLNVRPGAEIELESISANQ